VDKLRYLEFLSRFLESLTDFFFSSQLPPPKQSQICEDLEIKDLPLAISPTPITPHLAVTPIVTGYGL
jgi:hypothetical protein